MSEPACNVDRLLDLAEAVCDKTASQGELAELDSVLLTDEASRRGYLRYCRMHVSLKLDMLADEAAQIVCKQLDGEPVTPAPSESGAALLNPPLHPLPLLSTTLPGTVGFFSSGWPAAYLMATAILGIALAVGALVPISQPVQVAEQPMLPSTFGRGAGGEGSDNVAHLHHTVGRITGMVDCKWEEGAGFRVQGSEPVVSGQRSVASGQKQSDFRSSSHQPPATSHSVSLGDRFALASGLMEITYDSGAKVILQGPVTYEVEAKNGGFLSVGKLTARLEKNVASGQWPVASKSEIANPQSLIPNPLFSVRTPTATVTDLGTEFGVEVDKQGGVISHVYRGSVTLQVTSNAARTEGHVQVLHENQSARVENRGSQGGGNRITMLGSSAKAVDFVREIHPRTIKTLDLVDVVAGGDGFSGRRNAGIDPTTGRVVYAPPPSKDYFLVDEGGYHRVAGLPFVDGVFVPNGSKGPVQISSAGHDFLRFPSIQSWTSNFIWAGGAIPTPADVKDRYPAIAVLDHVDYSTPGHALLAMHANKGITFDLDAIRRANPGCKLLRFRAVAGNTEPDSAKGVQASADFWVLVDGYERFQRQGINGLDGGVQISVLLGDKERFLTLAATDGGNGIASDLILFGDPRLELLPVKSSFTHDTVGQ